MQDKEANKLHTNKTICRAIIITYIHILHFSMSGVLDMYGWGG
jgi:hypothetical protein